MRNPCASEQHRQGSYYSVKHSPDLYLQQETILPCYNEVNIQISNLEIAVVEDRNLPGRTSVGAGEGTGDPALDELALDSPNCPRPNKWCFFSAKNERIVRRTVQKRIKEE